MENQVYLILIGALFGVAATLAVYYQNRPFKIVQRSSKLDEEISEVDRLTKELQKGKINYEESLKQYHRSIDNSNPDAS